MIFRYSKIKWHRLALIFFALCPVAITALAQQSATLDRGRIAGRITDKQGDAIKGARVLVRSSDQYSQQTTTDADGKFVLESLPAGDYELRILAEGFGQHSRRITIHSNPRENPGPDFIITLETGGISDEITVTPARAEVRLIDAPASVSVLDSRDIGSAGAQTLDDLLRQIPGFSIFRRSSSIVANPTTQGVSLRGAGASGASRTLVLADGVPLNDAFGGWVYWDRVPRRAVDRIELMRGGSSDLYGSDALSGVINLLTRPPSRGVIDAEASYGTRDTSDLSLFASERWKGLGIAVSGESFTTDGYFITAPEIRGLADEEAASRHRVFSLRLDQNWSGDNTVFARGSLFDEDRRNGTRLQRNDTATESVAAGVRARTSDGSNWNLVLFANQQRFHQSFTAVAADRNSEALTRLQFVPSRDAGLSFNWSRSSFDKHLFVAGIDVRGVRGTSDETGYVAGRPTTFVSAGGRQRRFGVFAQDLFSISPRWQLAASARFDSWRDSSASSVEQSLSTGAVRPAFFDPRSTDAFSPRITLTYRPKEQLALRAAAYRAFRAPTLNELYRAFRVGDTLTLANERLNPERLTGGEIGANWNWTRRVNARLTGYWTETVNPISNFTISVTPSLITRQRRNLGRTRSLGLEAESEFLISNFWSITAGYLYAGATVRRAPQDPNLEGLWIPQVPRHQFTLQTLYSHPKYVTAAIQFRAAGMQFDDDQNRLPLGSFAVIDAMVARPINRYIELFFAAQNLFNERYAVARTPIETLGMPRMLRGGVRVKLER
jgi:outer membrane receptor protein involved in Fe transport